MEMEEGSWEEASPPTEHSPPLAAISSPLHEVDLLPDLGNAPSPEEDPSFLDQIDCLASSSPSPPLSSVKPLLVPEEEVATKTAQPTEILAPVAPPLAAPSSSSFEAAFDPLPPPPPSPQPELPLEPSSPPPSPHFSPQPASEPVPASPPPSPLPPPSSPSSPSSFPVVLHQSGLSSSPPPQEISPQPPDDPVNTNDEPLLTVPIEASAISPAVASPINGGDPELATTSSSTSATSSSHAAATPAKAPAKVDAPTTHKVGFFFGRFI